MLPLLELADQNLLRRSGISTTHTQSTHLETLPNETLAQIFNHYIVHQPELNRHHHNSFQISTEEVEEKGPPVSHPNTKKLPPIIIYQPRRGRYNLHLRDHAILFLNKRIRLVYLREVRKYVVHIFHTDIEDIAIEKLISTDEFDRRRVFKVTPLVKRLHFNINLESGVSLYYNENRQGPYKINALTQRLPFRQGGRNSIPQFPFAFPGY